MTCYFNKYAAKRAASEIVDGMGCEPARADELKSLTAALVEFAQTNGPGSMAAMVVTLAVLKDIPADEWRDLEADSDALDAAMVANANDPAIGGRREELGPDSLETFAQWHARSREDLALAVREACGRAQGCRFERLKEFGVRVEKNEAPGWINLRFRNRLYTVKKTEAEIIRALAEMYADHEPSE